jgi:integrase/recombinase XerD
MQSHHPENERIKRRYLTYLKEARGFSEDSLDQVAKALHRYETYTKFRDFRTFHVEQVRAFKQHLRNQRSQRFAAPGGNGAANGLSCRRGIAN